MVSPPSNFAALTPGPAAPSPPVVPLLPRRRGSLPGWTSLPSRVQPRSRAPTPRSLASSPPRPAAAGEMPRSPTPMPWPPWSSLAPLQPRPPRTDLFVPGTHSRRRQPPVAGETRWLSMPSPQVPPPLLLQLSRVQADEHSLALVDPVARAR